MKLKLKKININIDILIIGVKEEGEEGVGEEKIPGGGDAKICTLLNKHLIPI